MNYSMIFFKTCWFKSVFHYFLSFELWVILFRVLFFLYLEMYAFNDYDINTVRPFLACIETVLGKFYNLSYHVTLLYVTFINVQKT